MSNLVLNEAKSMYFNTSSVEAILPKVNTVAQFTACRNTLTNLILLDKNRFTPECKQIIESFIALIDNCIKISSCCKDKNVANLIIKTTVNGILNTFVINEMHPSIGKQIGHRDYGRFGWMLEENIKPVSSFDFPDQPLVMLPKEVTRTHYTRRCEMRKYAQKFMQDPTLNPLYTVKEFEQVLKTIEYDSCYSFYFVNSLSKEEINYVVTLYKQYSNITIIIPFIINSTLGGYALCGGKMFDLNKDFFIPQSEPAIQEILEAILESGISVIQPPEDKNNPKNIVSKKLINKNKNTIYKEIEYFWDSLISHFPKENITKLKVISQARTYSMISDKNISQNSEQVYKSLLNNYKEVLGKKQDRYKNSQAISEIYLTRTGLSAAALGVQTAAEYFGGFKINRPLLYVCPGFYYEAEFAVRKEFNTAASYTDSGIRIYCINVSPNPPLTSNEYDLDYIKRREVLLAHIYQESLLHPENEYFLIIDKTTNILFNYFPSEKSRPNNLNIFEAISLTKHRYGDTNHFSGLVIFEGNKKLKPYIEEGLVSAHGTLSERDIYFFYPLIKSEIRKNFYMYRKKSDLFTTTFIRHMKQLPKELQWKTESHFDSPQYLYIIPPMRAMIRSAKKSCNYQNFYKVKPLVDNVREISKCYKNFFDDLVFSIVELFQTTPGFNKGSSFGLNDTRVTFIPGDFYYQGSLFLQEAPRISFGIETTSEEIISFTNKLAEKIINETNDRINYL